jgi:hypothetical protein
MIVLIQNGGNSHDIFATVITLLSILDAKYKKANIGATTTTVESITLQI